MYHIFDITVKKTDILFKYIILRYRKIKLWLPEYIFRLNSNA